MVQLHNSGGMAATRTYGFLANITAAITAVFEGRTERNIDFMSEFNFCPAVMMGGKVKCEKDESGFFLG